MTRIGVLAAPARPVSPIALAMWVIATATVWVLFGPLAGAAVAAAVPVLLGIVLSPVVRVVIVIGGGLFVLGSTSDVSAAKLVYSALVVVCLASATVSLLREPPAWADVFRPMLPAGGVLLTVLVVGSVVGGATSLQELGRQAIFYVLIIGAPVLGIDAARRVSPRAVKIIVYAAGLIAAAGFAADWLNRRGVSSLAFGRFVVSSLMLPAFGFAFALISLVYASGLLRRLLWLLPAVVIPVAMLVPGTRTNLVLGMAIVGELGPRRFKRIPPGSAFVLILVCGLLIAVVFPLVAGAVVSSPDFISERLALLFDFFSGNTATDGSYLLRTEQYQTATHLIAQHPLFGVGVGYSLNLVLDTPLASPAKIGILGVGAVVLFVAALAYSLHRASRRFGPSSAITAFWGFLFVSLSALPFGTPLDDPAYGFTLTLIVLAVASTVAERHRREVAENGRHHPASALTNTSAKRSGV